MSVLIPTRGRPDRLRRCLQGISAQSLERDRFEVVVGVDGPDEGESALAARVVPGARAIPGPHAGPAATRNRLLDHARGEIILWLNDDVVPHRGCLAAHLATHESRDGGSAPAMVVGAAPWKIGAPDRLLDRLIRESSMIFFYDTMEADGPADPGRDWGFRHAWTLNLSIPRGLLGPGGRFDGSLPCACYEDLEWAWRVTTRCGAPVLYRPDAIVEHDHRYTWAGYLERERMLGREAFRLARAAPDCARAIFGRDVSSDDEVAYARLSVDKEARDVRRQEEALAELLEQPSFIVDGPQAGRLIRSVYLQHLPVKRWHWRRGLVDAAVATSLSMAG